MNDLPLSEIELDQLEAFFTREDLPESCMDLSMLDGFCTALAIGPNLSNPEDWLPLVWGEPEPGETSPNLFADPAEARRISGLVLRFYNDRFHSLAGDIDVYEPLVYEHEVDGRREMILDEWCTGFVTGIQVDAEGWHSLLTASPEDEGALLSPMLLFGTVDGWKQMEETPELQARRQDFIDAIPPCVLAIRDYWLPFRKAGSTIERETPKVGRNDPCPCGSGRKFKKCCGG